MRSESDQRRGELARSDQYHPEQDERPEPVADDFELPPHPEMLLEHHLHVRLLLEHRREVLQPEDVQVAYQAEQHADEEEVGGPVDPRGQLKGTGDAAADRLVADKRDPPRADRVPGELVGELCSEAGGDEAGEEAGGAAELSGVSEADTAGFGGELVEEEEAAETVAAGEFGEGEEREGGGGGEGDLRDEVVRAALGAVGEREVGQGRHGNGEEEEHGPRDGGAAAVRLVQEHPTEERPETAELDVFVFVFGFLEQWQRLRRLE